MIALVWTLKVLMMMMERIRISVLLIKLNQKRGKIRKIVMVRSLSAIHLTNYNKKSWEYKEKIGKLENLRRIYKV